MAGNRGAGDQKRQSAQRGVVEFLDELGQRQLPGLLIVIGEAAELFGSQSQFPGHLDVGMGKTVALARLDPLLVLLGYLFLLHHGPPIH